MKTFVERSAIDPVEKLETSALVWRHAFGGLDEHSGITRRIALIELFDRFNRDQGVVVPVRRMSSDESSDSWLRTEEPLSNEHIERDLHGVAARFEFMHQHRPRGQLLSRGIFPSDHSLTQARYQIPAALNR